MTAPEYSAHQDTEHSLGSRWTLVLLSFILPLESPICCRCSDTFFFSSNTQLFQASTTELESKGQGNKEIPMLVESPVQKLSSSYCRGKRRISVLPFSLLSPPFALLSQQKAQLCSVSRFKQRRCLRFPETYNQSDLNRVVDGGHCFSY